MVSQVKSLSTGTEKLLIPNLTVLRRRYTLLNVRCTQTALKLSDNAAQFLIFTSLLHTISIYGYWLHLKKNIHHFSCRSPGNPLSIENSNNFVNIFFQCEAKFQYHLCADIVNATISTVQIDCLHFGACLILYHATHHQ